jgi:hypothetical protein
MAATMALLAAAAASASRAGGPYLSLHAADSMSLVRRAWLPEDAGAPSHAW